MDSSSGSHDTRAPIPGSDRRIPATSTRVADIDPGAELEVTIYMRARDDAPQRGGDPGGEPHAQQTGVGRAARGEPGGHPGGRGIRHRHGLAVRSLDAARRAVVVRGTVAQISRAFGAHLEGLYVAQGSKTPHRERSGPLTVPASLAEIVTGVFGIDDRPQASAFSDS